MDTLNNINRTNKRTSQRDRAKKPGTIQKEVMDSLHEWNLKTLEEMYGKEYVDRINKSS